MDWATETGRDDEGPIGEFGLEIVRDVCGELAASVKLWDTEEDVDEDGIRSVGDWLELLLLRDGKPEELRLGDKSGDRVGNAMFGILIDCNRGGDDDADVGVINDWKV